MEKHRVSLPIQLSDLHETAGKPTQDVLRERLQHLATVENLQSASSPEFDRWADTRLDRWLVDWALRNGKARTARRIAKEKDIEVRQSRCRLRVRDIDPISEDSG